MLKYRILIATLVVLLLPTLAGAAGSSKIVSGDMGNLSSLKSAGGLSESARNALQGIVMNNFDAAGNEEMVATGVHTDEVGAVHVRFTQRLNGLPVAGAGMALHAHADGKIFGVNGEFVSGKNLPVMPSLDGLTAVEIALGNPNTKIQQLTRPELTYVLGSDGEGYLAWQVTIAYRSERGPHRDIVFADAETGRMVARHPQIKHARDLETRDCNQKKKNCTVVSTDPNTISLPSDTPVEAAHNFAIATYDYYFNNHGRDSIDDAGMTLVSNVHFDRNLNNAYWDQDQMWYGDGDGVNFGPLSEDADVVAHELTHGVTEKTSGLIYANESGALNEAWSDIFGALVDRQTGATGLDIWKIGEDITTPGTPGDALRYMHDPALDGYSKGYYPERLYPGSCTASNTNDACGVHGNSGIANLAFQLLVDGGTHPRGKTSVVVPSIGFDAAADIFYAANAGNCLTPGATFALARYCTADIFGGTHTAAVHLAWDAVGVPNDPPDPPNPPIALTDGVALGNQDATTDNIQQYTLSVAAGHTVTCSTTCNNGDADLYLRFGADADVNPNSTNNECGSFTATSNESCTTGAAPSATTLFAGVHAFSAYTNLSITCTDNGATGSCDPAGSPCGNCCNGCSGGKPSTRVCL